MINYVFDSTCSSKVHSLLLSLTEIRTKLVCFRFSPNSIDFLSLIKIIDYQSTIFFRSSLSRVISNLD